MQSPVATAQTVQIHALPLKDQWRWTLACWWRAVVFVALQCILIFGVVIGLNALLTSAPPEFARQWPIVFIYGSFGVTELVSAALGLLSVRAYLGWILGKRVGAYRLELVRCDG